MPRPIPEPATPFARGASFRPSLALGAGLLLSLVACGGGASYGSTDQAPPAAPPSYQLTSLVSDQASAGATTTDPNLVNPWGLAYGPATDFWLANQGTATSTVYDGQGLRPAAPITVSIPMMAGHSMVGPTGIVFNGTASFLGDTFVVASLEGCLCGWSSGATMTRRVDNSGAQAVYTGLATGTFASASYLFAANFNGGTIDVFDGSFAPVNLGAGALVDPGLPAGYAPFNVQVLGGRLYVTYARHDPPALRESAGPGQGYVSVFTLDGAFVQRLASGGALNAPWGMALAPASFGTFGGTLLVGNFGDGHISAFDPATGDLMGQISDASGAPMVINGLWGLAFGNDLSAGRANQLYVTAGPQGEAHGLFATISWSGNGTGGGIGGGPGY